MDNLIIENEDGSADLRSFHLTADRDGYDKAYQIYLELLKWQNKLLESHPEFED